MTPTALFNGIAVDDPARAIALDDRGLNYGDGLFETALLKAGEIRFLDAHLQRLHAGCERLGIPFPGAELTSDLARLSPPGGPYVLKIVVTRGRGGRGYRPAREAASNRIISLHPVPPADPPGGIALRWCRTQLSRNPALAGIKHLNRLEQVLAQNEWHDADAAEGLVCDTEGEVVSATACNLFIVRNGVLLTSDLRFCGVRGVMRSQVLRAAREAAIPCGEEPLWPHDIEEATEVFLTNAVRGIRPVATLESQRWSSFSIAQQLTEVLRL